MRREVGLLAAAQALLLTNGVTLVATNGLAGLALASDRRLATLSLTAYVIGAALTTLPASFFMKRRGRRACFMLGAALGIAGALLSALAVWNASFWLLCLGTLLAGGYNAFGQQYRFAAADAAPVAFKARAISWVMAGGIVGGVLGPETGKLSRELLQPMFLGTYLSLAAFAAVALLIASRLALPTPAVAEQRLPGRPLGKIARQPAFVVAVLAAASGYGIMNLLMTSTPLAMDICGHPFADTAFVLEWHVFGMFAPSFFTGGLIRRFGVLEVLLAGTVLLAACIGIALAGVDVLHFWLALTLLGVGWNFLYIGGTTLLTETYRPEEKAKAQGSNDFTVFAIQGVTSFASGALVTTAGWQTLNAAALPVVAFTAAVIVWLLLARRRAAAAA